MNNNCQLLRWAILNNTLKVDKEGKYEVYLLSYNEIHNRNMKSNEEFTLKRIGSFQTSIITSSSLSKKKLIRALIVPGKLTTATILDKVEKKQISKYEEMINNKEVINYEILTRLANREIDNNMQLEYFLNFEVNLDKIKENYTKEQEKWLAENMINQITPEKQKEIVFNKIHEKVNQLGKGAKFQISTLDFKEIDIKFPFVLFALIEETAIDLIDIDFRKNCFVISAKEPFKRLNHKPKISKDVIQFNPEEDTTFGDNFFITKKGQICKNMKLVSYSDNNGSQKKGLAQHAGYYLIKRLKRTKGAQALGKNEFKPKNSNASFCWSTIKKSKSIINKCCGNVIGTNKKGEYFWQCND